MLHSLHVMCLYVKICKPLQEGWFETKRRCRTWKRSYHHSSSAGKCYAFLLSHNARQLVVQKHLHFNVCCLTTNKYLFFCFFFQIDCTSTSNWLNIKQTKGNFNAKPFRIPQLSKMVHPHTGTNCPEENQGTNLICVCPSFYVHRFPPRSRRNMGSQTILWPTTTAATTHYQNPMIVN